VGALGTRGRLGSCPGLSSGSGSPGQPEGEQQQLLGTAGRQSSSALGSPDAQAQQQQGHGADADAAGSSAVSESSGAFDWGELSGGEEAERKRRRAHSKQQQQQQGGGPGQEAEHSASEVGRGQLTRSEASFSVEGSAGAGVGVGAGMCRCAWAWACGRVLMHACISDLCKQSPRSCPFLSAIPCTRERLACVCVRVCVRKRTCSFCVRMRASLAQPSIYTCNHKNAQQQTKLQTHACS